jgi:hypothetical protein
MVGHKFGNDPILLTTNRGGKSMTKVKAKAPKVEKEAEIMVDLGENLEDATSRFGAEVVFSNYLSNVVIGVQAGIRRYLDKGKTVEEIQGIFNTYKPGTTLERVVDPMALIAKQMEGKSEEEMNAFFEKLRAKIHGGQA